MFRLGPLERPEDARRLLGLPASARPPQACGPSRASPTEHGLSDDAQLRASMAGAEVWVVELDGGAFVRSLRGGRAALDHLPERSLVVLAPGRATPFPQAAVGALVAGATERVLDVLWCAPSYTLSARAQWPRLPWHPALAWCMRDSLEVLDPWANIARFQLTPYR